MAYIVQKSAQGACDHQGSASAGVAAENVKINGQAVLTVPATFSVAGCSFTTPDGVPKPCAMLLFTTGATKVRVNQMPVLLGDATPQATGPLGIQGTGSLRGVQTTVKAQ
ncbi:hypothetical protein [Flavimaricola marinus]|uniref:PAAR motif protein n=1 Tax=Flavimaricola marinus TaxID=1819565 RepID=A0A238L9I1_9RHOB|nr:hypothetical protein [Flavimaricola marinus]SMY06261.1 hypothetical protein LOM8899_00384 [Flavimaricola marinus]